MQSTVSISPYGATDFVSYPAAITTPFPCVNYATIITVNQLNNLYLGSGFTWYTTVGRSGGGGNGYVRLLLDGVQLVEFSAGFPATAFTYVCTSALMKKGSVFEIQTKADGGSGVSTLNNYFRGEYSPFI